MGAVAIKPSNLKSRRTFKHGRVISGAKLKRARLALGLTQLQVARMLGLQLQNVSRLEKGGQPDLRISTADRLARLFGVTMESLLK